MNIDDCLQNTCLNGGICVDEIADYYCDCPADFIGRRCETLTRLSFMENAYLAIEHVINSTNVVISLNFATTLPNGIIFYSRGVSNIL